MANFVKLKDENGDEVAVNLDTVTKIIRGADEELTEVYFIDEEDPLLVEEAPQDILEKAKKPA